jgi:hypothetical protein
MIVIWYDEYGDTKSAHSTCFGSHTTSVNNLCDKTTRYTHAHDLYPDFEINCNMVTRTLSAAVAIAI